MGKQFLLVSNSLTVVYCGATEIFVLGSFHSRLYKDFSFSG